MPPSDDGYRAWTESCDGSDGDDGSGEGGCVDKRTQSRNAPKRILSSTTRHQNIIERVVLAQRQFSFAAPNSFSFRAVTK